MQMLEIKTPLNKKEMKKIIKVLHAFGISASFRDDTRMSKQEFINKIEKSRKSKRIKLDDSEMKKLFGVWAKRWK